LWPGSKIIGLLNSEARDIGLLDPERRIVACLGMPITDEILIQVVDLVAQGHSRIFLFPQASRSPSQAGHAEHASMPPKPETLPVNGAKEGNNPVRVLSRRERELLDGVASGHSNKRIALDFGLTEATVKVHLKSIFRKLGVSNRTQAAIFFLGLIAITPLDQTAQSVFKHSASVHRTRASSVGDASATSLRPRNE